MVLSGTIHYVVRVRLFRPPHHKANVLIPVTREDDVNCLERWFWSNTLDTNVHCLDNDDDVVDLVAIDQLIMLLDNLATSGEEVLHNSISNSKQMRRAARRAHTSEPCRAPSPAGTTNTQ